MRRPSTSRANTPTRQNTAPATRGASRGHLTLTIDAGRSLRATPTPAQQRRRAQADDRQRRRFGDGRNTGEARCAGQERCALRQDVEVDGAVVVAGDEAVVIEIAVEPPA